MTDVSKLVANFGFFLSHSLESIQSFLSIDTTGSLRSDWMQANWELLVEGALGSPLVRLEVYGDGADCNPKSSRFLSPNLLPTHHIVCVPVSGDRLYDFLSGTQVVVPREPLKLDRLVTMGGDGWRHEAAPFDKVLVRLQEVDFVFCLSSVRLELQRLPSSTE